MPKSRKDIYHLNAGEWSRKVYGRVDHEKHSSACRQARNVISWPHGAVSKRKGFELVAPTKYDDKICRPVRFRFSKSDTMLLEMGHEYVRFHVNGQQVREAPTGIGSMSAANPIVATATGHGYSDGNEIYLQGFVEMPEMNERWVKVASSTSDTFEIQDRDGNDIDGSAWTAEATGGTAEKVYEIASIYTEADLYNLDYAQKNDVMWFCDGAHPVQQMIRFGLTSWTISEYEFAFPPALDPNVEAGQLLEVDAKTGTGATMTAGGHTPFSSAHVGSYWVLRHFRKSSEVTASGVTNAIKAIGNLTLETSGKWSGTVIVYKAQVQSPNLATYTASEWTEVGSYTSNNSTDGDGKNFNVRFTQDDESRYYHMGGSVGDAKATLRSEAVLIEGAVKITGFTSATEVTVDIVRELESTDITEDWSEGAWSRLQGYPRAMCLFEKAIWFANTSAYPQGIWKSETDLFDSFQLGTDDTSALFIELDSKERNDILWMVDQDKLMIGTSGSEWTLAGTDLNSVISPTNIVARRQENKGSQAIRPETVDDVVMYVQRGSSQSLRALSFSIERDKFHALDMQEFSDHLTAGGLRSIAYQPTPDPIVWCCTGDGKLLSFTYERDQNVYAWNPHDTDGDFEGVEVIYGSQDDEVWVATNRTISGVTRRFLERMSGDYNPSLSLDDRSIKQDAQIAFCVDTTLSMRGIIDDILELADQIASVYGSAYRDVQFALIGFKDEDDSPVFEPNLDFTSYTSFKIALEGISTSGGGDGPENGYGSIVQACNSYSWNERYAHEVLMFTDESSHERGATQSQALSALNSIDAVFHFGTVSNAGYQFLSDQTGGFNFNSLEDFLSKLKTSTTVPESDSKKRFVDCSKYYDQNSDLTIRGLWHLEGEAVEVLADGYHVQGLTVTNGAIVFDSLFSTVFVGLKYEVFVQPLQINADSVVGSSTGYTKVMSSVYADLIDTIGLKYSDGSKSADGAIKYRDVTFRGGNQDQSLPPQLFNGEVELIMNTGHERDPILILKHDAPLPFTLAGLIIHYDVTGE